MYSSNFTLFRKWWKSSRKRTHGYNKAYIAKTPIGDVLKVEHNQKEEVVKLSIQEAKNPKIEFISVVKKGVSIREKELPSNSNTQFKRKIYPFRDVFASLPDDDILECLSGIYGLPLISRGIEEVDLTTDKTGEFSTKESIPNETFFQRLKRFTFYRPKNRKTFFQSLKERAWSEAFDLSLGICGASAAYFYFYDYVILGFSVASMGFLFGWFDWFFRKRDPLLLKVILFFGVGSYFFYTGYTVQ